MKTLQELEEIRKKTYEQIRTDKDRQGTRILVGMATCGIAAGAKPVLNKVIEEVKNKGLKDVSVVQTGCIGVCRLEPIIEVYESGKERVTYVKMTPEKAAEIVDKHIAGGNVCAQYTIGESE